MLPLKKPSSSKIIFILAMLLQLGLLLGALSPHGQAFFSGRQDAPKSPAASPGSLDPSFDSDGKVTTDIAGVGDFVAALALQADGKIVVAGYTNGNSTGTEDFALVRYQTNGQLDPTFGTGGKVVTPFGTSTNDRIVGVAVQPADSKIVVAGYFTDGTTSNFALARYTSGGQLDTSFDGDGKATISFPGTNSRATAVQIQSDGKIVVAGYTLISDGTPVDFAVARYNPSTNALDPNFDGDGRATTDFNGAQDRANALIIQANGSIVLGGSATLTTNFVTSLDLALARYLPTGALDNSFGSSGRATVADQCQFAGDDTVNALALQTDGKIIAFVDNGCTGSVSLARFQPLGFLDSSFGTNGLADTPMAGPDNKAVALTGDGKILVAGHAFNATSGSDDFTIFRYQANGVPDTSWDADGRALIDLSGNDAATALAVQTDGKILVAGTAGLSTFTGDFGVARLLGGDNTCTYQIAPTSRTVTAAQTSGQITVTTQSGCAWTATTNDFINISDSGPTVEGSGSGTVNYTVFQNVEDRRVGTVTVAGQTFTITQEHPACQFFIDPSSQTVPMGGGVGSVNIFTFADCAWTATSNVAWISISSGATGTGNGTTAFSVQSNGTGSQRQGTLTIAGRTLTVTQSAIPGPGNDNFANATVISNSTGTITGNNTNASREAGEPATTALSYLASSTTASVWYRWQAPATGSEVFIIDYSGGGTPLCEAGNTMEAFTGTALNGLTLRANNNYRYAGTGGLFNAQRVNLAFDTVAGTIYNIRVDRFDSANDFTLRWSPGRNISGRVKNRDDVNITGVSNPYLRLAPSFCHFSEEVLVSNDGNYTTYVPTGTDLGVTPDFGANFSPNSFFASNITQNITQDFTAVTPTFNIQGRLIGVPESDLNNPNLTITAATATGTPVDCNKSLTAHTINYTCSNLTIYGNWIITPQYPAYTFRSVPTGTPGGCGPNLAMFCAPNLTRNLAGADFSSTLAPPPTMNIGDASLNEGNSGDAPAMASVTVSLSAASAQTVTVNYATADGTATAGTDYSAVSGTLTFQPGETSKSINMPISGDDLPEPDETFTVNLTNPANATLNDAQSMVTILNDDAFEGDVAPTPLGNGSVTGSDVTRVRRLVAGLDPVNLSGTEYQRADCAPRSSLGGGGALTPADVTQARRYAAALDPVVRSGGPSNSGAGPQGEKEKRGISGAVSEHAQMVRTLRVLSVSAAGGGTVIVPVELEAQGTEFALGFSLNFDATKLGSPVVTLGSGSPAGTVLTVNPNQTGLGRLGLTLDGLPFGQSFGMGLKRIVEVRFNVLGTPTGTSAVTFGDVPITREVSDEQGNVLATAYENGVVTFGGGVEQTLSFSSAVYNVNEAGGGATLMVLRSGNTTSAVTVDYATSDGTALQRTDYTITLGALSFAAGETSKTFIVPIADDLFTESAENLTLTLSNPSAGATLGAPASATLTITDDDTAQPDAPAGSDFSRLFVARLNGASEVPATNSTATGSGTVALNAAETQITVNLSFSGLSSAQTAAHIHAAAHVTANAPVLFTLNNGTVTNQTFAVSPQQVQQLRAGLMYFNVHTTNFTGGEIRGQIVASPVESARFFVRQQYADFLSRLPDQAGEDFWVGQIVTVAGADLNLIKQRRVAVSNAFFFEQEYQQTGAYTYRLYRAAFGNTQPFPNSMGDMDSNPYCTANPNNCQLIRAAHVPAYTKFAADRARLDAGNLAATQLSLATQFAQRAEFVARYPLSQTADQYVDALLATIQTADGANLTSQRTALIALYNGAGGSMAGRGAVLFRLAEDNAGGNPINNRAFIDAEYNRAFVTTQYFGYLRRDADMPGLNFWLSVVNQFPLRSATGQNGMVCAFITAREYQERFGPGVTRSNQSDCP